ncbi:MAG: SPFH domain-containing protein [Candidatus Kariarchaeaceae archaeon]|jgi:regulator of protease activity HflC (stomatin/prohibitin superfamily)
MKVSTIVILVLITIGLIVGFGITGCERIDAGHVGIRVNLYGTEKGVDQVAEVTGIQWYFKPKTQIHEFPTFVQNAIWTADETEGSKEIEEFRVTTKDGLTAKMDVSLNFSVLATEAVNIFKKFRKPLDEIAETVLRNWVREGYNMAASEFTAEQLYEHRAKYTATSEDIVRERLEREGFTVEELVILNEIRLPSSVITAIEAKVNATQIAIQKEQEVQQAVADAQKRVAKARGDSASYVISAAGEARALRLKKQELNSLLVQQMFIERWDGSYGTNNVFGADAGLFIQK